MLERNNLKRFVLVGAILFLTISHFAGAQSGTVEGIEIQGLRRMSEDAFLHAMGVRVGDPYEVTLIRSRFKDLWDLGLFEDISIETALGEQGGQVLIIKVRERPRLVSVSYDENKSITRTQIEDRLEERGFPLKLGKPLDLGAVFFAEAVIRDLLAERGFLDGKVTADIRKVTATTRAVDFKIVSGGKTRIREIRFSGNNVFSKRKLTGALKLVEARKPYWPWSKKNLYHPLKWDQDAANIRDLYRNSGYLDAVIHAPSVEVLRPDTEKQAPQSEEADVLEVHEDAVDGVVAVDVPEDVPAEAPPDETAKQRRKRLEREEKQRKQDRKKERNSEEHSKHWAVLNVEIAEGQQYTLGEISFEGNDRFKTENLRRMIPLAEGDVLQGNLLDVGIKGISDLYENIGHLYSSVVRSYNRHTDEAVADVAITIEEDVPYIVSRIDFKGNHSTRDKVLRREMLIAEGEVYSRTLLDISRQKINQLGYWQSQVEPLIVPKPDEHAVDVTIEGQEQGRNEIQIGGGYSGFDGAFFSGVYSTRNFLGRGQTVSVSLQVGGRSNRYQISFQEPWFLNRPVLLGFSVFLQEVDYGTSLRSDSTGFGVILGRRVGRFSNFNVGYNYELVSSTTFLTASRNVVSENVISRVTPVYSFSTVNNPYRPTRGISLRVSAQIAGGPLGGDTAFIKPVARLIGYKRVWGKTYLSVHTQLGYISEWADGSEPSSSNINGIPRFQRFWLGGETLGPRVFESRTITPRRYVVVVGDQIVDVVNDPRGLPSDDVVGDGGQPFRIEVGGNRMWLAQTEYVIPMNQQMELAFFLDAGDSLFEDQSMDLSTTRVSAGVEARFHLPIFPVPLRLIYGVAVRELDGDRSSNFTFSIGKSF
jgi:outer membrane protein insertion porin family